MEALKEAEAESAAVRLARERELAAVKVDAADVALLQSELELEKEQADRMLRVYGGDARAALRAYVAGEAVDMKA